MTVSSAATARLVLEVLGPEVVGSAAEQDEQQHRDLGRRPALKGARPEVIRAI